MSRNYKSLAGFVLRASAAFCQPCATGVGRAGPVSGRRHPVRNARSHFLQAHFWITCCLPTIRELMGSINRMAFIGTNPLSLAANLMFARQSPSVQLTDASGRAVTKQILPGLR